MLHLLPHPSEERCRLVWRLDLAMANKRLFETLLRVLDLLRCREPSRWLSR